MTSRSSDSIHSSSAVGAAATTEVWRARAASSRSVFFGNYLNSSGLRQCALLIPSFVAIASQPRNEL